MRVSLFDPGFAIAETIGYNIFQNALVFGVISPKAKATTGIIQHASGSTNMTIPVTNWDELLSGRGLINSVLQLVI